MSKSLKQKNQPQIITFLVVNTCVLLAVILGPNRVLQFLGETTKGDFALLGKLMAAPAVLSLLVDYRMELAKKLEGDSSVLAPRRIPATVQPGF
jgi:hypothetical protein